MKQSFAVAATEVCESRCIAIVWLKPNVDLLSLGHVLAVIEAVIRAICRITISGRRLSDRLCAAEQGFERNGRSYSRHGCGPLDKVSSASAGSTDVAARFASYRSR